MSVEALANQDDAIANLEPRPLPVRRGLVCWNGPCDKEQMNFHAFTFALLGGLNTTVAAIA